MNKGRILKQLSFKNRKQQTFYQLRSKSHTFGLRIFNEKY